MTGRPILTAAETRAAEAALFAGGVTVEGLMERAGAGVAEAAWRFAAGAPTVVLCGPGNNGGDGYVVARLLEERGVKVRVAATAEPRTDAARAMRARWSGPVEAAGDAAGAPVLIDALFGTGLSRPLDGGDEAALGRLAAGARLLIAVDLPSGVATDDGAALGDVPRFDLTVALGVLKPAHRLQPAAASCGRVVVVPLDLAGLDAAALREVARPALAAPGPADHKYSRGMVAVAAGPMAGASLLSAEAAPRAGAGYALLAGGAGGGPHALVNRAGNLADALDDARIGAVVIGPGLGRDAAARARLAAALACGRPLVIDADALMLLGPAGLARIRALSATAILTPHEGEFGKLFGALAGSKVERARAAAVRAGAVVVLKGADTVIASPDGRAAIARPASAWLASAGTGDVLAGVVGAMRARGLPPFEAACAGVWLHARAAEIAGPGLIADDLIPALRAALVECL